MTAELRVAMGEAAVNAARSIDYVGAGTVEFLLDDGGDFYFLEMNTRLQVEHPVTEMITGIDLVALQFRIAQGYPLPMSQDAVSLTGHAMEVRLYAEDSSNDFLPATGRAVLWQPPAGEGIRVDHGLRTGQDISPFYDPMIAKIIAFGEDRETARRRLIRALENTVLFGVANNRRFLIDALARDDFATGAATTAFIDDNFAAADLQPVAPGGRETALAAVLQYRQMQREAGGVFAGNMAVDWGWRTGRPIDGHFCYGDGDEAVDAVIREHKPGVYSAIVAGETTAVTHLGAEGDHRDLFLVDDVRVPVWHATPGRGQVELQCRGQHHQFTNALAFTAGDAGAVGSGTVTAPMHGSVLQVAVAAGDTVAEGQLLAIMEAMKMEHRLIAEVSGVVSAVHIAEGDQVAADTVILAIEEQ
jgi:geranyl-CoA carboxylase alpha subunit